MKKTLLILALCAVVVGGFSLLTFDTNNAFAFVWKGNIKKNPSSQSGQSNTNQQAPTLTVTSKKVDSTKGLVTYEFSWNTSAPYTGVTVVNTCNKATVVNTQNNMSLCKTDLDGLTGKVTAEFVNKGNTAVNTVISFAPYKKTATGVDINMSLEKKFTIAIPPTTATQQTQSSGGPKIISVSPSQIRPGDKVTITGVNFQSTGNRVYIDSTPIATRPIESVYDSAVFYLPNAFFDSPDGKTMTFTVPSKMVSVKNGNWVGTTRDLAPGTYYLWVNKPGPVVVQYKDVQVFPITVLPIK